MWGFPGGQEQTTQGMGGQACEGRWTVLRALGSCGMDLCPSREGERLPSRSRVVRLESWGPGGSWSTRRSGRRGGG